jgi:hypothetical protein
MREKEMVERKAARLRKLVEKSLHLQSLPQFQEGQVVEEKDTGEQLTVAERMGGNYMCKNKEGRYCRRFAEDLRPCGLQAIERDSLEK